MVSENLYNSTEFSTLKQPPETGCKHFSNVVLCLNIDSISNCTAVQYKKRCYMRRDSKSTSIWGGVIDQSSICITNIQTAVSKYHQIL